MEVAGGFNSAHPLAQVPHILVFLGVSNLMQECFRTLRSHVGATVDIDCAESRQAGLKIVSSTTWTRATGTQDLYLKD